MRGLAGAVLAAQLLAACSGQPASPAPGTLAGAVPGAAEWRTDFGRAADGVTARDFVRAVPVRDAIPALDNPRLVPASSVDWIGPDEPVIAVEAGGEWRAYPLQIMLWHEIANDVLGGRPIAVTFCPLCHTAVVFDRRLAGSRLDFGVSGYLRRSDLVMYDRQTESWWQQATGIGLLGIHAGSRLELLPSSLVAWASFTAAHPGATVLDRETGHSRPYGRNPYPGWDRTVWNPFLDDAQLEPCDGAPGCLDPKERVGVVSAGGETLVLPFRDLAEAGGLVQDRVGGVPVVVWWVPDVRSVLDNELLNRNDQVGTMVAFDRRVDGRTLDFEIRDGALAELSGRNAWDSLGEPAVAGAASLTRLQIDTPYWFGFAAFGHGYRIWGG